MPRPVRIHASGGYYHVTLRGNHRAPIFESSGDRRRWEEILAESLDRAGSSVHAYCWMTNHVHLLVQVGETPLESLARRIASRYARWFQRRIPTSGHLFERRYRAQLIRDDAYLLAVTRYIHYNPVRAQLTPDIAAYPWTSHRAYAASEVIPWLTTHRILELLDACPRRARAAYLAFMAEVPTSLAPEVTTAPLPQEPMAAARKSAGAGPASRLPELAARIAAQHGIAVEALCAGARGHSYTRVRALIAWEAVSTGVATLTQTARFVGCSVPALAQALDRLRRRAPHLFTSRDKT